VLTESVLLPPTWALATGVLTSSNGCDVVGVLGTGTGVSGNGGVLIVTGVLGTLTVAGGVLLPPPRPPTLTVAGGVLEVFPELGTSVFLAAGAVAGWLVALLDVLWAVLPLAAAWLEGLVDWLVPEVLVPLVFAVSTADVACFVANFLPGLLPLGLVSGLWVAINTKTINDAKSPSGSETNAVWPRICLSGLVTPL
jgi:hypothetical protein